MMVLEFKRVIAEGITIFNCVVTLKINICLIFLTKNNICVAQGFSKFGHSQKLVNFCKLASCIRKLYPITLKHVFFSINLNRVGRIGFFDAKVINELGRSNGPGERKQFSH